MEDESGSIRTSIQGQSSSAHAAAGERAGGGVALEVGISASTLERWHSEALAQSPGKKVWTATARFDAMLVTAAMDEAAKGAWCRANGVYLKDLQAWRESATQALAGPQELRASPNQTKQDRRRIKELERSETQEQRLGRDDSAAGAVKKTRGDLPQGRGRMIGLEDRQSLVREIRAAHSSGARLHLACELAGIDVRTLQRWNAGAGLVTGDGRPQAVRPVPSHALSAAERE